MIGIDIGINGALALLDENGEIVDMVKPTIRREAGKQEWNGYWLSNLLEEWRYMEPVITMEACGYHYRQVASARSLAMCEGIVVGVASSLGFSIERVQAKDWQKAMLGKVPGGMTKEYALARAKDQWPDAEWARTKRCTTEDDGFVDAALIALYGLKKTKGEL